ncbi:MAG: DUF2318 domain-containing protein [Bifidobacteriaceae bacterium]|jgi:hypothetical protein|nr:DUF2318 domain-containing protein [Bifidobacteriaceae bacterium]
MLHQFVQVVAVLAPPALLLAIVMAWGRVSPAPAGHALAAASPIGSLDVNRGGRVGRRPLAAGLAVGLAGGIGLAVAREAAWLTERETVNLVLSVGQVTAGLVLLVAVAARLVKPNWLLGGAVATLAALSLARAASSALLGFSGYVMPGRTVLSTEWLGRVVGFAGGVVLVVVAAYVLVQAAAGTARRGLSLVLAAALVVTLAWQAVAVVQYFQGRALIHLPRPAFKALAWGINHQGWQLGLLLALALALPALRLRGNLRPTYPLGALPPDLRLIKATARRRLRYGAAGLVLGAGVALAVTLGSYFDGRQPELSPAEPFAIEGTLAVVHLEQVDDGHLHRFAYTTASGVEVRFIVIKKNGVAYGVGLDACEICGATGYYERDGKIICRLCDVVMNVATIGFRGGCNPIPLDYVLADGAIQIDLADLDAAAHHFA